ncbi:MAG: M48 family metalloprotease [Saprospiraceae bacterium]|nr:M48 family metalloprotease [Saprospiraceae bacterium]
MRRKRGGGSLIIALAIVAFAAMRFFGSTSVNPVTGKTERVSMSAEQEIALGLQSRDQMAQQFGGLYPDRETQLYIDQIGERLVRMSDAARSPYPFDFHVLNDPKTVNAFALPGGQIFITTALLTRLREANGSISEDQVAGVLGHEIAHVIERHGAERMAEQEFFQTLTGAAGVATGNASSQQMAQMVANFVSMSYGRKDELESDDWGVKYMIQAGYDPSQMVKVMQVLKEASGGTSQPEFSSTHPSPENRIEQINFSIQKWNSELGR